MPIPTLFKQLLQPTMPQVRQITVLVNASALTTYTFTDGAHGLRTAGGNFGSHENVILENPGVPSPSRKGIYLLISGLDNATAFGVNSATIGGVAGTELIDRGGGTVTINSAIYAWSDSSLANITAFDIVVTFSEALASGCGVVLVEVSNIQSWGMIASGSAAVATGGTIDIDVTGIADPERMAGRALVLVLTTFVNTADSEYQHTPGGAIQDSFAGVVITPNTTIVGTGRFGAGYYLVQSVNGHNDDTIQNIRVVSPGGNQAEGVAIALA